MKGRLACPHPLVDGHIELANAEGESAEDMVTDGHPGFLMVPTSNYHHQFSLKREIRRKEGRNNKLIDVFVMFRNEMKVCD